MALVSRVIGDCPSCGRKDGFGNVSISNNQLHRGCLSCRHWESIHLPVLNKKILYLDQYFFSHAFRGQDSMFVEAKEKIKSLALDQLIIAPYSNFHEDESQLWTPEQRQPLFKFIKQISGGHQFEPDYKVKLNQICNGFKRFLEKSSVDSAIKLSDAIPRDFNQWDDYFWIDVRSFVSDPEKLRKGKGDAVNLLLDAFAEWSINPSTFDEDVAIELKSGAKVYFDQYIEYVRNIAEGQFEKAFLESSTNSQIVEVLMNFDFSTIAPTDRMQRIFEFFQSEYYFNTPVERISSELYALLRCKLRQGFYKNKQKSKKVFKGFFYDVSFISTYAPYCDAMVLDSLMHDWVTDPKIDLQARFGTRFFSRTNWSEFIEYLENINSSKTVEHTCALKLINPSNAKGVDWSNILKT